MPFAGWSAAIPSFNLPALRRLEEPSGGFLLLLLLLRLFLAGGAAGRFQACSSEGRHRLPPPDWKVVLKAAALRRSRGEYKWRRIPRRRRRPRRRAAAVALSLVRWMFRLLLLLPLPTPFFLPRRRHRSPSSTSRPPYRIGPGRDMLSWSSAPSSFVPAGLWSLAATRPLSAPPTCPSSPQPPFAATASPGTPSPPPQTSSKSPTTSTKSSMVGRWTWRRHPSNQTRFCSVLLLLFSYAYFLRSDRFCSAGKVWAGHNILRFDCLRIREAFEAVGRPAPEPVGTIDSLRLLSQRFGKRAGDMKVDIMFLILSIYEFSWLLNPGGCLRSLLKFSP